MLILLTQSIAINLFSVIFIFKICIAFFLILTFLFYLSYIIINNTDIYDIYFHLFYI